MIYGCDTDNPTDGTDATRTLGMLSVAWIGMHQNASRTPRIGIQTLWRLADGVYESLFLSRMSAHQLGIFMITLRCPGGR